MSRVRVCMSRMLGRSRSSSDGELVWYVGGEDIFLLRVWVRRSCRSVCVPPSMSAKCCVNATAMSCWEVIGGSVVSDFKWGSGFVHMPCRRLGSLLRYWLSSE